LSKSAARNQHVSSFSSGHTYRQLATQMIANNQIGQRKKFPVGSSFDFGSKKTPFSAGRRIAGLPIPPLPSHRIHILPSFEETAEQSDFSSDEKEETLGALASISDARTTSGQLVRMCNSFRSRSFSDRRRAISESAAANCSSILLASTFK
jgi:hypothetical protein